MFPGGGVIGDGCTILQHVTIGSNTLSDSEGKGAPSIGNNVFIGAGACVIGNVRIGNDVRIGANTTVYKDVPDNCTVVAAGGLRVIQTKVTRDNTFHNFFGQ